MKDFGKEIKEQLSTKNITVSALCAKLNIDESTYFRKIASGGNKFSIEQINKMVEVLSLTKEEACRIFLS
jgi:predicted transcriptional regulator